MYIDTETGVGSISNGQTKLWNATPSIKKFNSNNYWF